ncbi:MAG: C25 family cysteine peptidase [Ignavibacteriaceae bacterium]
MIKFLLFFLSIISLFTFAQQTKIEALDNSFSVSIYNYEPKYSDTKFDNFTVRDYYEFTDPAENLSFKLSAIDLYFAIPQNSKVTINDLNFDKITLNKIIPSINPSLALNDSGISYIPNEYQNKIKVIDEKSPVEIVNYFYYRDFYIVHLKVNNFNFNSETSSIEILKNIKFKINSSNQVQFSTASPLKIITDFDKAINKLISNSNIAEQFRSNTTYILNDTTGNWIDYNSTYLKLGVGNNGIYRITKTDLSAAGVPVSVVDPRTFQLFESGDEIKMLVKGQDDGIFDNSDYMEFWGKKNYPEISYRTVNPDNEEYNEYLNRYTDTTFYFLRWDRNEGKRIDSLSVSQLSVNDTIDYYSQLIHSETQSSFQFCDNDEVANQTPNWIKNKSWFWNFLITQQSFNFTLSDVYPDKNASIYFKLVSFASNILTNSHQVELFLNNSLIDSNSVDRYKQLLMRGNFNSSNFLSGTNQIKLQNLSNGSSPNSLITDWYDVEYPRYLNLINDSLYFKIADDVSSGLKILKVGNATQSQYRIYKVKPEFKIINNYSVSSSTLFFADTVLPGNEYFVISDEKNITPKFYYLKDFKNLRSITDQTDYISITHPKFLNSTQNYVQSIGELYNLTTSVYNVEDIFDEFSFGYPYPEAIRLFANILYNNAQSPKPSYLTLIGDANYDYKYFIGKSGGTNYVPSFGNPVSDNWFAVWDPAAVPIPQLKVGRIPVNDNSDIEYYLSKIQNNESTFFDDWNKRYLLFSGGRTDVTGELEYLKAPNDSIISKFISPSPISGEYMHFYKTRNPQSDFGPYSNQEISNAISAGGLFISYIGHSGTSTWDNSINSTNQLYNNVNRNPLITDFGCSTNKYAEPNIVCFGERFLFTSAGQALGYVGNSSLGFQSTAVTAPLYFYEELFNDSLSEVGNASLYSKIELLGRNGNTSVNRLYALTNIILGDPTVRLKIPKLPNLSITGADIITGDQQLNESVDSVEFKIALKNLGPSKTGNLEINIKQIFDGSDIKNEFKIIPIPEYADTFIVWVLTKDKPGTHLLNIQIDPDNLIDEIYENDNSVNFQFNVYSSSLRDLLTSKFENPAIKELNLLNPVNLNSDFNSIEFQLSQNIDFTAPTIFTNTIDNYFTKISLPDLLPDTRYYFKYKINSPVAYFSDVKSFYNKPASKFLLADSLSFTRLDRLNSGYKNAFLQILSDTTKISVLSAGYNAGATCVISKDGVNLLSNTYFAGMGIVVFDNVTLKVDTSTWFNLFNLPANVEALATMIDSISYGKIVAIGVADDAKNNLSTHLKNAIKSLGSSKIDSLVFRGSWALIGWKGAPVGKVLEGVKSASSAENVVLDTSYVFLADSASFITPLIGVASKWKNIQLEESIPEGVSTKYLLLGQTETGQFDTLRTLIFSDGKTDISDINSKVYPKIKIEGKLFSSATKFSPQINQLAVDFTALPELGTNFQVVRTSMDSVEQGKSINLSFGVYNIGEAAADSFNVIVELIKPNNSAKQLYDTIITKLDSASHTDFNINYLSNAYDGSGNMKFRIKIDPESRVKEFYKDNNIFDKSFYIIQDTSITSITESNIKITFDGIEIIDGDFVGAKPEILINLQYPVWFPVNDTSAIHFQIDGIEYLSSDILNFADSSNRIVSYKINPELSNGDHIFTIFGRDRYGNINPDESIKRLFTVNNNLSLLNVYNYPNPFSDQTFFTFKLTQIPDELEIRIFTIAGRLIKIIKQTASQLNFDFNKIAWNGRDEEGDAVASGVYLYKVILKKSNETKSIIQKLAVIR